MVSRISISLFPRALYLLFNSLLYALIELGLPFP
jgi:hypothetical protein